MEVNTPLLTNCEKKGGRKDGKKEGRKTRKVPKKGRESECPSFFSLSISLSGSQAAGSQRSWPGDRALPVLSDQYLSLAEKERFGFAVL